MYTTVMTPEWVPKSCLWFLLECQEPEAGIEGSNKQP